MRIIAGSARHRPLKSVPDMDTRPTTDRVKECIFNIIGPAILDLDVLDLFAGTGNMGLEAISRGAHSATFVDLRLIAIQTIQENIATLKFETQSRVIQMETANAIQLLSREGALYHLIFLDPPYHKGFEIPMLESLEQSSMLGPKGWIVVRHHIKTEIPECIGKIYRFRQKKFGDGLVSFYKYGTPERTES